MLIGQLLDADWSTIFEALYLPQKYSNLINIIIMAFINTYYNEIND